MSNENLMEVLKSLDEKIEDLLLTNSELKSERDRLQGELNEANQQKEELAKQINSNRETREEMHNRIQGIIQKIEQMES
ncbi:MAG: cell division protein ZapB [Candidatus Omnitrophica bacterium]|nr:cell division protein ZapB [Candidatus Omnitrophota bacterium]